MLEAYVSRESENAGYYWVVPSVGGGAVEAIDIQRSGFAIGERVTIIQIGSEYGIAEKAANLPGVVEVPKTARDALAIESPAQFFCAYLGAQLGRFKRLYALGEVVAKAAALSVKILAGIEAGKVVSASPSAGFVTDDFSVGDKIPLQIVGSLYFACGWWEAMEAIKGLRAFNTLDGSLRFVIPHRKKNGDLVLFSDLASEDNPCGALNICGEKTEVGTFLENGDFLPYVLVGEYGPGNVTLYGEDEQFIISFFGEQTSPEKKRFKMPNRVRFSYALPGESKSKAILDGIKKIEILDSVYYSLYGDFFAPEATTAKIFADGSALIRFFTVQDFFSALFQQPARDQLDRPQDFYFCKIGDFYGAALFSATLPPGSVVFEGEPGDIILGSGGCSGEIDINTGVFSVSSAEGGWSIAGVRQAGKNNTAFMVLSIDGEEAGRSNNSTFDIEEIEITLDGEVFPLDSIFYAKKYTPEAA
jgi:hypothetical protein